ncbi:MAG TPA: TadE/TadG family type IV pilus assembly protein [Silvibacterium sp.]|nr:TadE/TadG family type IV pilus assembly protein [Silvibacterium sp.]
MRQRNFNIVAHLRLHRDPLSSEAGGTLIETALSISLLMIMLFAVIEVSLALYSYHFISNAACEATRYAIVRGSTWGTECDSESTGYAAGGCTANQADIQTYVQSIELPGIDSSNLTVTPTWATTPGASSCSTCNSAGDVVQVEVDYSFPFSVPFLPKRTFSMSSTSEMVISQ